MAVFHMYIEINLSNGGGLEVDGITEAEGDCFSYEYLKEVHADCIKALMDKVKKHLTHPIDSVVVKSFTRLDK